MNEDWAALMNSEVMRNYLQAELAKEAAAARQPKVDEDAVVKAFMTFEHEVRNDPNKLLAFKELKKKFASDQAYADSCDPLFVQAVMMLEIDEQD